MTNDRIHHILESFAEEIREEVQRQAMAALSGGFVGGTKTNGQFKARAAKAAAVKRGRKGAKRDPKALEALVGKVGDFIAKHPGLRVEEINKQLGTTTKELALPIKKLIEAKTIKAKGQRRSTKYYAK